ncbi:TetR/AcrR family transcriptional regulator [Plantactinospora sp. B5E13]|uniref:TetR/AcrR family transcriptional regulator n=1 Tax=unclassified Plantactinospora TaxID=2631981 RepID=UPI00325DF27D
MTDTTDAPRAPGRPRSIRADEAILEAALDLLAEGSAVETLSIESIASRAQVGKATIYRRWSGKEALLQDALRRLKPPPPEPPGDSVREDLIMLVSPTAQNADPRIGQIMPCIMPTLNRSPEQYRLYQDVVEPRRRMLREVLRRGIRLGEIRADIDVELVVSLLTAPLVMQRVLRANPHLDETDLPIRIVDTVIAGIAAR